MDRTVKLSRLPALLDSLDYPLSRRHVVDEADGVTVLLADGEVALERVADDLVSEEFGSQPELQAELYQFLPIGAVGEPGQSEGDA
jgi:hypothetical protein